MYDVKQLIAAVRTTNGIRVEPDDPIFAFVTISELVLEQFSRRVSDEITIRLVAFKEGMDQTERRAGHLLAEDVRKAAAQIRAEMQKDIEAAGMKAAHLVYQVDQAHKRCAPRAPGCFSSLGPNGAATIVAVPTIGSDRIPQASRR